MVSNWQAFQDTVPIKDKRTFLPARAKQRGEEVANKTTAYPGQSEHQTGLAMDVSSASVNYQLLESFGETTEGIWLAENAPDFGFIIRYPKGKEEITGYSYEPWHLRYLGIETALQVSARGITYEEYLANK
jgi:D-alanyl-D-alanine carboxypeptidase